MVEQTKKITLNEEIKVTRADFATALIITIGEYDKQIADPLENVDAEGDEVEKCFEKAGIETERMREPTFDDLQKRFKKMLGKSCTLEEKNKVMAQFVYVSGHGQNVDGQQALVLNELHPKTDKVRTFPIESKLRNCASNKNYLAVAVFDSCRQIVKAKGGDVLPEEAHDESGFVFIYGCAPALGVSVNASIYKKFFEHMQKKAERRSQGIVVIPQYLLDVKKTVAQAEITIDCQNQFAVDWSTKVVHPDAQEDYQHLEGSHFGYAWQYFGQVKDGKAEGRGKRTYAKGHVEEGEFKDGELHGKGKRTCANGEVQEGEWKDGKMHGKGKRTWADGEVVEGELKDGELHGQGKLTYANGYVKEGEWKDGRFLGR